MDLFELTKGVVAAHDSELMRKANGHFLESFGAEVRNSIQRSAVSSGAGACQVMEHADE